MCIVLDDPSLAPQGGCRVIQLLVLFRKAATMPLKMITPTRVLFFESIRVYTYTALPRTSFIRITLTLAGRNRGEKRGGKHGPNIFTQSQFGDLFYKIFSVTGN